MCPAPLFSIIVPVYGAEAYFPACVASVTEQPFTDWELILVDDGSPDGCPALCDAYAREDARITAIHTPNQGISAACNRGISAARGEYMIQLDNDDYLAPDALSRVAALLEAHGRPDILQCNWMKDTDGKIQDHIQRYPPEEASRLGWPDRFFDLAADWRIPIPFWSRAIRIDFLRRIHFAFRSEYDGAQDLDGMYRCFVQTRSVVFCDVGLTYHRSIATSASLQITPALLKTHILFYADLHSRYDDLIQDAAVYRKHHAYVAREAAVNCDNIMQLPEAQREALYSLIRKTGSIYRRVNPLQSKRRVGPRARLRHGLYRLLGCERTHRLSLWLRKIARQ